MKLLTIITNLLAVFVLGACTSTAFGSNRDGLEIGVEFDRINDIPSLPASSNVQVFDASDELDVSGLVYLGKATNRKALNNFSESPSRVSARGDLTASIIDIARRNGGTLVVLEADNDLRSATRTKEECQWREQPTMEGQIIGNCFLYRTIFETRSYQESIGDIYRNDPALLASLRETRRRKAEEAAEAQRLENLEIERRAAERLKILEAEREAERRRVKDAEAGRLAVRARLVGDPSSKTPDELYLVAKKFWRGEGVAADPKTASELWTIACERDHGNSCYDLAITGWWHTDDTGRIELSGLIHRSCEYRFARGCSDSGNLHLYNSITAGPLPNWGWKGRAELNEGADLEYASDLFDMGCSGGDPRGCYFAGALIVGYKNETESQKAYSYFSTACRETDKALQKSDVDEIRESCVHAAYLVYTGRNGSEPNRELAMSYLDKARSIDRDFFRTYDTFQTAKVYDCMRAQRSQC